MKGMLTDCNTMAARYLFQQDKHYDVSYDTGDKVTGQEGHTAPQVIQCGRHNDIFKFWLAWRAKGTSGFEFQMDRIMELAQYQVLPCSCSTGPDEEDARDAGEVPHHSGAA